ncbi:MAG: PAS domain-containing protein [Bacteroidales bacterium]|nr:PAS domain-containing protein [Bacteroidales bacterium]
MALEKHNKRDENLSILEFLEEAQMLIRGGFWYWDISKPAIEYSNQVFNHLGFKLKNSYTSIAKVFQLIHPNDRNLVEIAVKDLIDGKAESKEIEFRAKIEDGSWKAFLVRAAIASKDNNGKPKVIVGSIIDISHQKELLQKIELSERRLKKTQRIAHIGSWESKPLEGSDYWSKETYKIFGFKKGSVKPSIQLIAPYINSDDLLALNKKFDDIKRSTDRNLFNSIFRYIGPDQVEKNLQITVEVDRDIANNLVKWHGVVYDITTNIKYERKLKEDKENLMSLVKNLPAMVYAIDHNNSIVFWNKACENITGYKSKEIIGNENALKLLYPDTELRKKVKKQLGNTSSSLSTWEYRLTTKTGEQKDIAWTAFNDYVKVEGWNAVAIGYDLTPQKINERIQQDYQYKLEALAQTATDLIGLPISESIYHYVGTQLEKFCPTVIHVVVSFESEKNVINIEGIYGLDMKAWSNLLEILGWNPIGRRFHISEYALEFLTKHEPSRINKPLYELSDGQISSAAARSIEKFLRIRDIFINGFLKENICYGGVISIILENSIAIDLSIIEGIVNQASAALNRKDLENKLMLAKEKAEVSDKQKSAFLANMSHEIRTPMNAIIGFSQLLALPNLSDEKKNQFIEIINNKGNNLVKLINDIIDTSKVESGHLTIVFAPCNLNNLLKYLQKFYNKEKIFQKREEIDIKIVVPDGCDSLDLVTDEGRLEQILTNLIGNALKYTERGVIEFGYSLDNNQITFFVKDTGVGIDPQMQTMIFERFRQVEDVTDKRFGGTGLGLSISKGIVNLLGGSIWVESKLGVGTTFYFTLPLQIYQNVDINKELRVIEGKEHRPDWRNKVILIAEDEEVNYIFIKEILSLTGAIILWAKDGSQAVDLVNKIKKIDLVLMDIKMPVMNGYAASMEIRQINPKLPIIAQTAYAFIEDRQKAEAAGCNDYLTKPINKNELYTILEKYLGS